MLHHMLSRLHSCVARSNFAEHLNRIDKDGKLIFCNCKVLEKSVSQRVNNQVT